MRGLLRTTVLRWSCTSQSQGSYLSFRSIGGAMRRREMIAGMLAAVGGGATGCHESKSAASSNSGQPTVDDLRGDAQALGFNLSDTELKAIQAYAGDFLKSVDRVAKAVPPAPSPKYGPRESARPAASENPLNAWYVTASIKGARTGPLSGKKIAVKDNVCVAGLPMMNGSKVIEGFVPATDATVVTRLLDAGAEIMRQVGVRELLHELRQPHRRHRLRAQPARSHAHHRRIVERQRGTGCVQRRRHGGGVR